MSSRRRIISLVIVDARCVAAFHGCGFATPLNCLLDDERLVLASMELMELECGSVRAGGLGWWKTFGMVARQLARAKLQPSVLCSRSMSMNSRASSEAVIRATSWNWFHPKSRAKCASSMTRISRSRRCEGQYTHPMDCVSH